MNIGNYYCVKTNTDKTGKIISCLLNTTDGKNQIVKDRDTLIKEMRNNRIKVINLRYSEELDKLNIVSIMNTDTGKRAESSAKASLEKIGSNLTTKSKGAIKGVYSRVKISIQEGVIGGYAAIYKNSAMGREYKVYLFVGIVTSID